MKEYLRSFKSSAQYILIVVLVTGPVYCGVNTWTVFENMYTPSMFFSIAKPNPSTLIIAGGHKVRSKTEYSVSSGSEKIEIVNGTVRHTNLAKMNSARAEFPLLVIDSNTLLALGGFDGEVSTTSVEMYNIAQNVWTKIGNLRYGRRQHVAYVANDSQVVVVGGRSTDLSTLSSTEIFNFRTGKSIEVSDFPVPINGAVAGVSSSGRGVICGGRSGGANSSRDPRIRTFDVSSASWSSIGKLTVGREAAQSFNLEDKRFCVVGGSLQEDPPRWISEVLIDTGNGLKLAGNLSFATIYCGVAEHQPDLVTIVGGWNEDLSASNRTMFYDLNKDTAFLGPRLNYARCYTRAATLSDSSGKNRYTFAVGGRNTAGDIVPSIEVIGGCTSDFSLLSSETAVLRGSAHISDTSIILTDTAQYQAGAAWLRGRIDVAGPFTMNFGFTLENGNDHDQPDGGPVGADGVAFVIQNESESPLGEAGRGIGYDNMFGGLAIEFDTYQNGAFADPSGSHVAVQTNDGSRLRASHVAPFLKGITYDGIPNFVANGTHYHAKVEYDGSVLSVYVGENKNLDKPCLVIPINIAQEVGTSSDGRAWLGFTSATGFSSQQHILDYASLSSCNPVITSVPLLQPLHEATLLVQPNPATLTTTITLPKHASGMLLVYEVTGAVHTSKQVVDQDTITLPVSDLAPGAYAIRFVPDNGSPLHSMLFIGR